MEYSSRLMEMAMNQKSRRPMTPDEMVRFYARDVERPGRGMSRLGQFVAQLRCMLMSLGQRQLRPALAGAPSPCA